MDDRSDSDVGNESSPGHVRQAHQLTVAGIALILCDLLWGLSFPLMALMNFSVAKFDLPVTSIYLCAPNTLKQIYVAALYLTLRFTAAILLFRIFAPRFLSKLTRRDWLLGTLTGIPFGAGMMLQVMGLSTISASRSGFLTSLSVLFTPFLVWLVYKKSPMRSVLGGCTLAILGSSVLTGVFDPTSFELHWDKHISVGDYLTIAASFMFSISILVTTWLSRRMVPSQIAPGMFLGLLFVSVPFLLSLLLSPKQGSGLGSWMALTLDPMFVLLTVSMSGLCTIIPFSLMTTYQHYFSEEQAALIFTLEPVFASLWAMFIPALVSPYFGVEYANESVNLELLLGGALIISGNCLPAVAQRFAVNKKKRPEGNPGRF